MKVPENNKGLNHAATFCVLGFKLHIFNVNFFISFAEQSSEQKLFEVPAW